MNLFGWELRRSAKPPAEVKAEKVLEKRRMKISEAMRERLNAMGPAFDGGPSGARLPVRTLFDVAPYTPPAGVAPSEHVLAMDRTVDYNSLNYQFTGSGFPGFPYLTELSQLTEYRDMSERVAAEMTRKWIKFRSTSKDNRSDKLEEIEAEFKRLRVREAFRRAAELDGLMGRGQIFIDLGEDSGPELGKPLLIDKLKIRQGRKLRNLKVVEPVNTYPQNYNSINPLSMDYFSPTVWFVQSQQVHSTRLLTFISRPLPNLLRPAYNFAGMSLSQLAQPYVDYWFSTRNAVGSLLKNFSTSILKTNMQDVLEGGTGDTLLARAKLYTKMRDNQGLFLLDTETEDFTQVNVPIAGLDRLQAQAQEHMAAVAKTPLIVLLGISPTGLNASSEGEIRVFYDYVADQQEKLFRQNLENILKIVQLSLYGEIYDDIGFEFVGLYTATGSEQATIRSTDGKVAVDYITAGVIDSQEERERLARSPDSGYNGLDLTKKIEKPMPMMPGQNPKMDGGAGGGAQKTPKKAAEGGTPSKPATDEQTFFGNQHTGAIGTEGDSPYLIAVKASGVASQSNSTATRIPTKRNFERALAAHERALEAHKAALAYEEDTLLDPVHEVYIGTHESYIEKYRALVAERQARIDAGQPDEGDASTAGEAPAPASPAMDGEGAGHAFRGNQYTGGKSGLNEEEWHDKAIAAKETLLRRSNALFSSGNANFVADQRIEVGGTKDEHEFSARAHAGLYHENMALSNGAKDLLETYGDTYNYRIKEHLQDLVEEHSRRADIHSEFYAHQVKAALVRDAIAEQAPKFGLDPTSIAVRREHTFMLNGVKCLAAGTYHKDTGVIALYTTGLNFGSLGRDVAMTLAHEQGHSVFESALRAYNEESAKLSSDPRVTSHLGKASTMTPGGELRHGLEKEYPIYSKLKVGFNSKSDMIEREDGVTQYSRDWWFAYHEGTATREQALHETFAEVHMLASSSDKTLFGSRVSPTWRHFYKAITATVGRKK